MLGLTGLQEDGRVGLRQPSQENQQEQSTLSWRKGPQQRLLSGDTNPAGLDTGPEIAAEVLERIWESTGSSPSGPHSNIPRVPPPQPHLILRRAGREENLTGIKELCVGIRKGQDAALGQLGGQLPPLHVQSFLLWEGGVSGRAPWGGERAWGNTKGCQRKWEQGDRFPMATHSAGS